ncbi:hypothetical protein NUW58_g2373 [Xylaria curta]|uniref:Uncharacterized protein n=1 Tax=Xylaria curta TaxID=42375 RepID=A0ACC1PHN1_9PEZI|nr:hypothetical protein NUW58_g2373 [Xylaria curta]
MNAFPMQAYRTAFWASYHIFSNPIILQGCREELLAALKREHNGGYSLDLASVELPCPVLLSTYTETLRLHPMGTSILQVMEDQLIDDQYVLKKGGMVLIPTGVQHHDPSIWGKNANKFDHLRFLRKKRGSRAFGGGWTLCPGRHLATLTILGFAAGSILNFDLQPRSGRWATPTVSNSSLSTSINQPDADFEIELRCRDGQTWSSTFSGTRQKLQFVAEDTDLLDLTCDQLRTFLLAGHDTPSATIAWISYEFSRNPRAISALRKELDEIFGPRTNAEAIYDQLISPAGPDLASRMSCIVAVIKEALRLHTPASTARYSALGTGWTIRIPNGDNLCVDDVIFYNCNSIIHCDPTIYGETVNHFRPEWWLGDMESMSNSDYNYNTTQIPRGAWRPFERGPRGCVGQEFATIEIRVIIVMIARQYEFTKVNLSELALNENGCPIPGDDGQYKVKSNLYNTRQITARPADGMMVTVKKIGERKRGRRCGVTSVVLQLRPQRVEKIMDIKA